jgi:hypothetical protein
LRTKKNIEQEPIFESESNEAVSSDSESGLDEATVAVGDNSNVNRTQNKIWSRPQHPWNSGGVFHPVI